MSSREHWQLVILLIVELGLSAVPTPACAIGNSTYSQAHRDWQPKHIATAFASAQFNDQSKPLDLIERAIQNAQRGESAYRRPVSSARLATLQHGLASTTGNTWTREKVAATVDYVHAHRRESRSMNPQTFASKLRESTYIARPGFHGNTAELAEARARGMVLTRDIRSQTFDLTQIRSRPTSLQLKVYQDPRQGLRSLQQDLGGAQVASRTGSIPRHQLDTLLERGVLIKSTSRKADPTFVTTEGPRIKVSPMRSFSSAAESQRYAHLGQSSLAELYAQSPTPVGRTGPGLFANVAGRAFFAGSLALDSAMGAAAIYRYGSGSIDRQEFYRQASGPAITLSFAGAGASVGSVIPVLGTVGGAVAGATVSIPFRLVAEMLTDDRSGGLNSQQIAILDKVLDAKYGVVK